MINQSEKLMRLHPSSDNLLGKLLLAHQVRGDLSSKVQQYEKAQAAFQAGVDLFGRFSPSMEAREELTQYYYLQCCQGLTSIAKEKQDPVLAIALAKKLIVPIRHDTFKDPNSKQLLLSELIGLAQLEEDAGLVADALGLRVRAVAEARQILGGDLKSNWYVYQQVFGAHQHLARLYRKAGDERHEFDAIRDYLRETEIYVREKDHSALLAETSQCTPENLRRLREAFSTAAPEGVMKRFTVPTDFDGVKYPFYVYVDESWQFLEDQFTWVEKVRNGKVPKEVVESFRRLYKIAKENKVSFKDLCVYGSAALATSRH